MPAPSYGESVVHSNSYRLETPVSGFSSALCITELSLRCDQNLKEVLEVIVKEGLLLRRGFNQEPLRCIGVDGMTRVLREVRIGDCGEHQAGSRLYKQFIHFGYYSPDATSLTRRC